MTSRLRSEKQRKSRDDSLTHVLLDGKDEVSFRCDKNSVGFSDFDAWLRSRFAIDSNIRLIYHDEKDNEIIPTQNIFKEGGSIRVTRMYSPQTNDSEHSEHPNRKSKSTPVAPSSTSQPRSPSTAVSTPSPSSTQPKKHDNIGFNELMKQHHIFAMMLIVLCSVALAPKDSLYESSLLTYTFQILHMEKYRDLIREAYVAFLCWSTTYLFVRRLWNPENWPASNVIQKFAADAVYGGLAAGGAVLLKFALNLK